MAVEREVVEVLDGAIARAVRAIIIGTIAAVGSVIAASVFVTREDMRLAHVEQVMPEIREELSGLNTLLAQQGFYQKELHELEIEQRRLQLQIDRMECIQRGEDNCHMP